MVYLFSEWQRVKQMLKEAKRIFFLSDYDGTLTPIVERPELANLTPETRKLLLELTQQRNTTVGIVSGRVLKDLQQRVSIRDIIYAGNHGLEMEGPGISFVSPVADEIKPIFRLLHQILSKALKKISGVLVENKGLTLSIHYRMVEDDKKDEVKNIFEQIIYTARSLGKVRVTSGKKVLEVRPAVDWDKGKAIALLLKRYGNPQQKGRLLPLYLGDDLTDEDGFKVINNYGGISIFIGDESANSTARYYLTSPDEVKQFIDRLLQQRKVLQ